MVGKRAVMVRNGDAMVRGGAATGGFRGVMVRDGVVMVGDGAGNLGVERLWCAMEPSWSAVEPFSLDVAGR